MSSDIWIYLIPPVNIQEVGCSPAIAYLHVVCFEDPTSTRLENWSNPSKPVAGNYSKALDSTGGSWHSECSRKKMPTLFSHVQAAFHYLHYPEAARELSYQSWKIRQSRTAAFDFLDTLQHLCSADSAACSIALSQDTHVFCLTMFSSAFEAILGRLPPVEHKTIQVYLKISQRVWRILGLQLLHHIHKIFTYLKIQQSRRKRCLTASWRSTEWNAAHD